MRDLAPSYVPLRIPTHTYGATCIISHGVMYGARDCALYEHSGVGPHIAGRHTDEVTCLTLELCFESGNCGL